MCGDEYEEFKTQTGIYDVPNRLGKTIGDIEKIENVLIVCERSGIIRHIPRKGLTKNTYRDAFLASIPIDQMRKYPKIKLPKGYSRTEIIKKYICDRLKENPSKGEIRQLQELAANLISWGDIERSISKR